MLDQTVGQRDTPEKRLQKLVHANAAIAAELSLNELLNRVLNSARDIIDAQYAALGVMGSDGSLEQVIHAGLDAATVAAIGELPKGSGLIGALLERPEPIRLKSLDEDPRSSGLPPSHPELGAFLGVPIRSASSVYGNLYLANPVGREEFSAEDENLVTALAATAGIAIENARLHVQSQRRQEWLRASAEVSHRLLASPDDQSALHDVADSVRELTRADSVAILLPAPDDPGQLVTEVVSGLGARALQGLRLPSAGSQVNQAIQEQRLKVLQGFSQRMAEVPELRSLPAIRHIVALPLQGAGRPRGAIVAARTADVAFSTADLELAQGFASQAGLALELADGRVDRHKLGMLEDRARIAGDLHNHVVQKLFAAGLTLQGTATMVSDVALRRQLMGAVDNLDDTIRTIRTSIFELQTPHLPATSVRSRVMRVLGEMTPVLGFAPQVTFEGPLDTIADEALGNEIEAVLRESLTNVAKHARASSVAVDLAAEGRTLQMTVADDGVGLRRSARRSGLSNMRHRAESYGGRLELDRAPAGGLLLRWTISLPD